MLYDIRQLQLHILDILVVIDKVCREHDIKYYLVAGTMLGAVRHKGFIPWDDDIDIAMPRNDYDRFMQHCTGWLPKPYEAFCAELMPNYPSDFAKIIDSGTTLIERAHHSYIGGIYVDVFPIDGITSNKLLQRIHFIQYSFYKKLVYFLCRDPYKHGHGLSCWIPLICRKCFSMPQVIQHLLRLQKKYNNNSQSLVVDHDFGKRGIMEPSVYGKPTEILFENKKLYGIEQADHYLSSIYGDYMTIPHGSKQKRHNFYFLDYHMPYREYVDRRQFTT